MQELLELVENPVSLETPVGDGESLYGDLIEDIHSAGPHEQTAEQRARDGARDALEQLNPRMRRVLALRFGLDGEAPQTLEEVGTELGITRERVRQLETRALRELRTRRARPRALPPRRITRRARTSRGDDLHLAQAARRRSDSSSIWRTRSRVRPSRLPISSSVFGSSSTSP